VHACLPVDASGKHTGAFTFDHVFSPTTGQQEVFQRVTQPLGTAALAGVHVSAIRY
jgi:H+/gluconate symporter-like permease